MKILYCGSAKSVLVKQWCDEFVKRGHKVYLMTFHDVLHKFEGTKIIKVPTFKRLGFIGTTLRWLIINIHINKIRPDVIHAHSLQTYSIIPAMFYKLTKKHIFSVVDCMGSDIGETTQAKPELSKKNNFIFKNTDLITVKDIYARQRIIELGCDESKIIIRPSFADDNPLLKNKIPKSFIFLRRFENKYRSTNLLEVVEKVVKAIPDAKFIFAKREGWLDLYTKLTEYNLFNNIEFINCDHNTILEALTKSEIYFDTFYSKNMVYGHGHGTTTVEAMFRGCKLVLPNRKEYTGFNCLTYEKGNIQALVDQLIRATKNDNLTSHKVMWYFSKQRIMLMFEDIYKKFKRGF